MILILYPLIVTLPVLLIGAYLATRARDVGNIRTTTRLIQWFLALGSLGLGAYGIAYIFDADVPTDDAVLIFKSMIIGLPITGMVIFFFGYLWMDPVSRKISERPTPSAEKRTNILQREGLASYSVADELRKWKELRDEGAVTEDEYQAARTRLISQP